MLSIVLTVTMFIKMTFMMDYADLVLLLIAQLLRFLIWSLTLMNFMKSMLDLLESQSVKLTLKILRGFSFFGAACFSAYGCYLIIEKKLNDLDVLSCKSNEFVVQSIFLIVLVTVFFICAVKITKLINAQISASEDDPQFLATNQSRKVAMDHIWLLLIWLIVVAVESFAYSLTLLLEANEDCSPKHVDQEWPNYIQFLDRVTNYQSWFAPLIWLYWPSKARKRENCSQKKARDIVHSCSIISRGINVANTGNESGYSEEDDNDGFSSLDGGESYLDYDNRSEVSA